MARVLVIEDEEVLRRAMVRALEKLPSVEVCGAGNLGDALASIDEQVPELILSDLDLPDRSGVELIGELAGRGLAVRIVFISAYLEAYGSRIPPHAGVRVLEKPVGLDDLRTLVTDELRGSEAGDAVAPFGAVDYLQLAGMGGHSVEVSLKGPGEQGGTIFVCRGEIWHAEDADGDGREALSRLLNLKQASVACRTSQGGPGQRTIEGRWEELVLDAARQADESSRDPGEDATDFDLDVAFDLAGSGEGASAGPDGFSAAMERGLEALLEKDWSAAREAFVEAQQIRPDDGVVAANLKRLADLGHGPAEDPE